MDGEEWELYTIINSKSILLGGVTIAFRYPIPCCCFGTSTTLTDRQVTTTREAPLYPILPLPPTSFRIFIATTSS
jgi:hypothetical protein